MSDSIISGLPVSGASLSLVSKPTVATGANVAEKVDSSWQSVMSGGKVSPQQPAAEQLQQAVSDISDYMQTISRDLQFQVDKLTGSTIVTVLDTETKEIIRQIPTEEVVAMARYIAENMQDSVKGLLMNSEG